MDGAPFFITMRKGRRDSMNTRHRTIVLAAIAGIALAAQTTASGAIQWPWKKDRGSEEIVLPPPAEGLPPGEVIILPPATVTEVPIAPNDVMARLDRAEARIRELTGQVEELAFRLHQTQTQLQAALGGQPLPNAAAAPQPVAPVPVPNAGTAVAAAQPSGQVMIDAPQNQPIDLTATSRSAAEQPVAAVAPAQVVSLGEPGSDYERAYAAILAGDYVLAEASFRAFLTTYPGDQRVSDAQYWLGESLFARGNYRDAADEFLAGYKSYPQSGKAADTLLKLGLSLAGLGEREAACSTYAEVLKKYPNSSNALRQRVATEQAVARCTG
jgi:tol-pal system protein YbgF